MIGAWAGAEPYSRRTGYISDLGAVRCGDFRRPGRLLAGAPADERLVCGPGPGHDASARCCWARRCCAVAARPGVPVRGQPGRGETPWLAAAVRARLLTGTAGAGTVIVGLVPEDTGSAWHVAGAVMYFAAGALALLVLGWLWLRQTPLGWFILACGVVSLAALSRRADGHARAGARHPGAADGLSHHGRRGRGRPGHRPAGPARAHGAQAARPSAREQPRLEGTRSGNIDAPGAGHRVRGQQSGIPGV